MALGRDPMDWQWNYIHQSSDSMRISWCGHLYWPFLRIWPYSAIHPACFQHYVYLCVTFTTQKFYLRVYRVFVERHLFDVEPFHRKETVKCMSEWKIVSNFSFFHMVAHARFRKFIHWHTMGLLKSGLNGWQTSQSECITKWCQVCLNVCVSKKMYKKRQRIEQWLAQKMRSQCCRELRDENIVTSIQTNYKQQSDIVQSCTKTPLAQKISFAQTKS